MKFRHPALFVALLALPVVAGGDRLHKGTATPAPSGMPAFAAGQILNLDPSGKFTPAQHASDVQLLLGEAASQSQEGLVEEASPVKGGGVMVNLQGRFQNAVTMSIDTDGHVAAPCLPAAEEPAKKVQ